MFLIKFSRCLFCLYPCSLNRYLLLLVFIHNLFTCPRESSLHSRLPPKKLPTGAEPGPKRAASLLSSNPSLPPKNSALSGFRTSRHRAIFSSGPHKHSRMSIALTEQSHGNWHSPQGPVSRYLSGWNRSQSPTDARRAEKTGFRVKEVMLFFLKGAL